ncbi:hypothetical protein BR93DRAFT_929614 [Coniochaeta sp. PMI_546]|nr:hypothetical protein BR93DRAFT_929614 [Coniochaeta sp. PMI_546]
MRPGQLASWTQLCVALCKSGDQKSCRNKRSDVTHIADPVWPMPHRVRDQQNTSHKVRSHMPLGLFAQSLCFLAS